MENPATLERKIVEGLGSPYRCYSGRLSDNFGIKRGDFFCCNPVHKFGDIHWVVPPPSNCGR